ncbi:NIPSNAP family protein [Saccharopolyspora shandongensis]|uniref:NIPSNAP family protein n=1 Tax=Saccharopolyspora shandongensis TaxID=418495 RepID=UPI0034257B8F
MQPRSGEPESPTDHLPGHIVRSQGCVEESVSMIYEIRTYRVDPGAVPEFEELFGQGYRHRAEYSPLSGFWHTLDEALSEVIHVWPYQDLPDRAEKRAAAAQHPQWPPATGPLVNRMQSEVLLPFDFVEDPAPGTVGPVFEITYDYFKVADLGSAATAWSRAIEERSKRHSLVLAGRLEFGQTNGIVQVWAYDDLDQRAHALDEAAARGLCPPADGPAPLEQVSKLMTPSAFSPLH